MASDSTQLMNFGSASVMAHIHDVRKSTQATKGQAFMSHGASSRICADSNVFTHNLISDPSNDLSSSVKTFVGQYQEITDCNELTVSQQ